MLWRLNEPVKELPQCWKHHRCSVNILPQSQEGRDILGILAKDFPQEKTVFASGPPSSRSDSLAKSTDGRICPWNPTDPLFYWGWGSASESPPIRPPPCALTLLLFKLHRAGREHVHREDNGWWNEGKYRCFVWFLFFGIDWYWTVSVSDRAMGFGKSWLILWANVFVITQLGPCAAFLCPRSPLW